MHTYIQYIHTYIHRKKTSVEAVVKSLFPVSLFLRAFLPPRATTTFANFPVECFVTLDSIKKVNSAYIIRK